MHTFNHHSMASILNLQGVIIYQVKEKGDNFLVKIGQPRKPKSCPHCQKRKYNKHGKGRTRTIRHGISVGGKSIMLEWTSRRFKCKSCQKTWSQSPPDHIVQGKQRSTKYCRGQALRTLQTNSFNQTRQQSGLSYPVLRKILHQFMRQKPLLDIPKKGDLIFGIDEHCRAKRTLATTITLLQPAKKLLGLIPQATAKALVNWCQTYLTYEQRGRVIEISMDMSKSLRRQIKSLFFNAKFVIDPFHVIAYLNQVIREKYRLLWRHLEEEQKGLLPARTTKELGIVRLLYQGGKYWTKEQTAKVKKVFKVMPEVAILWYVKEEARAIYRECSDQAEAWARWQFILSQLPELPGRTLSNFLEEILNYFENQTTNGFTEGTHNKCKLIKRISFGLKNPQVYVEKLELAFVKPHLLILNHTY